MQTSTMRKIPHDLSITRLMIGLLQGFVLYFLFIAADTKTWPATNRFLYIPLLTISIFVPLIMAQGIGNMRLKTLSIWLISITFILLGTAYYEAWLQTSFDPLSLTLMTSTSYVFFIFIGIFITQSLILSGDSENRWIANYTTYFDIAWKLAVQIALAFGFVGIFWLLLLLGTELFSLIKIDLPRKIILKSWFAIPATTLAISSALHVTDVKVAMVRGIRTLGLMLLSWLLPLMTLIMTGFLLTLIFRGLTPLWQTKHAAILLLCASCWAIILINAAYQDGHHLVSSFLKFSGRLSAILLVPIIFLTTYALFLRVQQYGWTSTRIIAAAGMLIIASYAFGYAFAALKPGPWLKKIEVCNIATAFLIIIILLAILTPLASPDRLSVANQLKRLSSGEVKPEVLDISYLRWHSNRIGQEALAKLVSDAKQSPFIREQAKRARSTKYEYEYQNNKQNSVNKIIAHTPERKLPESFTQQKWNFQHPYFTFPACLTPYSVETCDAWMRDMNGKQTILILTYGKLDGFQQDAKGIWQPIGTWNLTGCLKAIEKVKSGQFNMIPARTPVWPDLEILDQRFPVVPVFSRPDCPQ